MPDPGKPEASRFRCFYQPPASANPLDLRSPFLKIKQAKDHIANLERKRLEFLGENRHFGVPQYSPETDSTKFSLAHIPAIPDCIRLILGDVAHNLRTALDHLACELARSVGVTDPMVYFPIFENAEDYQAKSPNRTKGIPKEAKDLIDKIGPYGGHDFLLWGLNELDRIDKHRLVLTTTLKVNSWGAILSQNPGEANYSFGMSYDLKAGDKIAELPGKCDSSRQVSVSIDIAFGEPKVFRGKALFPLLNIVQSRVAEVVSAFGPNPL